MEANLTQSATLNSVSLPFNEVLPALSNKTLFWRPKFLAEDQGLSHLPFLFWLVESVRPNITVQLGFGNGSSYFAICQAVDKLDTDGRCYAVDPNINTMHDYNRTQYDEFSRLLALPYEQASQQFSSKSIDLLHINLRANHAGAAQILSQWLPLLSDSGLVLLQNSLEVQPQSWAIMCQQLKQQYPMFELLNDDGLLVIVPGQTPSDSFARLLAFKSHSKTSELVQNVFGRLGKACAEAVRADQALIQVQHVQLQLQQQNQAIAESQLKIDELLKSLNEHKTWLSSRSDEVADLSGQLQTTVFSAEQQKQQATQRIELLELLRDELKKETETLFSHVDELRTEHDKYKTLAEKLQQDAQTLTAENTRINQQIVTINTVLQTKEAELVATTCELERTQTELNASHTLAQTLTAENTRINQQIVEANLNLTTLKAKIVKDESEKSKLVEQQQQQQLAHAAAENRFNEVQKQLVQSYEQEKKQRFSETAALTQLLTTAQTQASEFKQQLAVTSSNNQIAISQLAKQIQTYKNENDNLKQKIQASELCYKQQQQINKELQKSINTKKSELVKVQSERNALCLSVATSEQQVQKLSGQARFSILKPLNVITSVLRGNTSEQQLENQRQQVLTSGLFDHDYYAQQYPDVVDNQIDLLTHYLKFGAYEGRNPSANFNSLYYLDNYPDVRKSGINPLLHYIKFGIAEHRSTTLNEKE